jgi:hypothetical protein
MASDSAVSFVLLTRLAGEFAARYRAGERPSLQEYIDRYPELMDEIRELFPAVVEVEQVKEDSVHTSEADKLFLHYQAWHAMKSARYGRRFCKIVVGVS